MKTAIILATYFGDRRNYPHNQDEVVEVLDKQIQAAKTLDMGCPCDLIIVNHNYDNQVGLDYLQSVDGTQTRNGTVYVRNRPVVRQDMSFGSYKYAYMVYGEQYDYYFFNEDDILPMKDNVVSDMIAAFEADPKVGFVPALLFTNCVHVHEMDEDGYIAKTGGGPAHAHGGVGLTSSKIMKEIAAKYPNYIGTVADYNGTSHAIGGYGGQHAERDFTHIFCEHGYKLKCISDGFRFKRLQDGRDL